MTSTTEAIDLPFQEAIDFFRQKTRLPSSHWTDVWKDAHSRAFMVAGAASDALLSDFQKAIQKALSDGTTLEEFRRDFDAIVERHGWSHTGEAGWRARIIYETNLSTAYSAGRYAQMTDPDVLAVYPYWEYRHTPCQHPRLMHLAWDGLTLKADDPWWDAHYPPNGWRCGCRVQVVSERGLKRMGKTAADPSPPTHTVPWTNPKTGEVHQVPAGIDPGFDYNMGKAWQAPVKSEPLRPADPAAREPSDALVRKLAAFVERPEGTLQLGPLAPRFAAALPGAPPDVTLPAETIEAAKRAGLTDTQILLAPLLLGDSAQAVQVRAGDVAQVLTAVRTGDGAIAGTLRTHDGSAWLHALTMLDLAQLAALLATGTPIGGTP